MWIFRKVVLLVVLCFLFAGCSMMSNDTYTCQDYQQANPEAGIRCGYLGE